MKNVLLATDASEHSIRAAKMLSAMARIDPEMRITVLHIVPLPEVLNPAAAAGAPLTLPMKLDEYLHGQVEQVLNMTVSALNLPADRVRRSHAIGTPAESILVEAKQGHYDLIVMGRRGLSPIKEIFVGSVSHNVLHGAPCPVMIVP